MKYVRSISRGVKKTDKDYNKSYLNSDIELNSHWTLGGCPKCAGDLFLEIDEDGDTMGHCLQCGFVGLAKAISI